MAHLCHHDRKLVIQRWTYRDTSKVCLQKEKKSTTNFRSYLVSFCTSVSIHINNMANRSINRFNNRHPNCCASNHAWTIPDMVFSCNDNSHRLIERTNYREINDYIIDCNLHPSFCGNFRNGRVKLLMSNNIGCKIKNLQKNVVKTTISYKRIYISRVSKDNIVENGE